MKWPWLLWLLVAIGLGLLMALPASVFFALEWIDGAEGAGMILGWMLLTIGSTAQLTCRGRMPSVRGTKVNRKAMVVISLLTSLALALALAYLVARYGVSVLAWAGPWLLIAAVNWLGCILLKPAPEDTWEPGVGLGHDQGMDTPEERERDVTE